MSEKSDIPIGDRFHQPDRLVLRHPVSMSEFGDSFFCSVWPSVSSTALCPLCGSLSPLRSSVPFAALCPLCGPLSLLWPFVPLCSPLSPLHLCSLFLLCPLYSLCPLSTLLKCWNAGLFGIWPVQYRNEKLMMPEPVRYQTQLTQSSIFLVWYRTELMNA
jgi:hypothetical protein